jgi:hypothetical protein
MVLDKGFRRNPTLTFRTAQARSIQCPCKKINWCVNLAFIQFSLKLFQFRLLFHSISQANSDICCVSEDSWLCNRKCYRSLQYRRDCTRDLLHSGITVARSTKFRMLELRWELLFSFPHGAECLVFKMAIQSRVLSFKFLMKFQTDFFRKSEEHLER